MNDELRELIDAGERTFPGRVFLEDARSTRTITYAELAAIVDAWSAALEARAVAPGASVLLDISDPLDFATSYLGVIAAGRCVNPIDPAMPDAEYARALTVLTPDLIVTTTSGRAAATAITCITPHDAIATPGARRAPDQPGSVRSRPSASVRSRTSGSARLRTSGSTGEPKVVELSQAQLLHVARAVAEHNGLSAADRGFNPLPLFHINAEVVALLATLTAGATLVLDQRFHRDGFWSLIEHRAITWINAVPAILTILSRDPLPRRPSALRFVRSASAALPPPVRQTLTDALGEIVVESYGMTEAASQITATDLAHAARIGSAGKPVSVQLQVRDASGELAEAGEIGPVWIRGAGVITSYVAARAAERFDADGWLDTGDLGHLDRDGYLFLAGRADDVINRGGQLVYPREIEDVLLGEPDVLDAIVVGRPHDILGAVPVAYVIARTTTSLDALVTDLNDRCRDQLSRYKRPVDIELVDDLPRAATGKIRRHEVRAAAMSGR